MSPLLALCTAAFSPPAHHGRVLAGSVHNVHSSATSSVRLPHVVASASERGYGPLLAGPFEFGFPLRAPDRATVRRELIPGRIWSFEQVQGLIYVHVPVRMTVVKLDTGGLFAYSQRYSHILKLF